MGILSNAEIVLLIANVIGWLIATMLGWLVKGLFDRLKELEQENKKQTEAISRIREEMPTNYARRDDLNDALDRIFDAIRRIEDNLGQKADRRDHYRN
jgi:hypothetical protein